MLSLLYLVVRALVGFLVGGGQQGRDDGGKDLEILVLRHQLRVLQRTAGRPKLRVIDRILLAAASRVIPRERSGHLPRYPGDPPPLASRTRAQEVDLPPDRSPRPATARSRGPCAHPPAGPGEPPLGLCPDRGRASQARPQSCLL